MKRLFFAIVLAFGCGGGGDRPKTAEGGDSLSIIGRFSGPESAQYYAASDEYFVSNVNGGMALKDDNGFISRLAPDGSIKQLKWIDGGSLAVTLHAPKGMVTHGDTLFVADIDSVRAFSIATGSPLRAMAVPGARFLNDLAISKDGVLYVSDSGLKTGMLPTTSDAIYRLDAAGPVAIAKGTWMSRPNGIAVGPEGVTFVTFGSKVIVRLPAVGAKADTIATLMGGSLDGLYRLSANDWLVSAWDTKTVYRVDLAKRRSHPLVTGVDAPADLGFDTRRSRVLIPLVNQNRIEIRPLR